MQCSEDSQAFITMYSLKILVVQLKDCSIHILAILCHLFTFYHYDKLYNKQLQCDHILAQFLNKWFYKRCTLYHINYVIRTIWHLTCLLQKHDMARPGSVTTNQQRNGIQRNQTVENVQSRGSSHIIYMTFPCDM